MATRPLSRRFYRRDSRELAPLLLNKVLVHGDRSVRLVEVEAYAGDEDPGSHAFRGQTPRNATMFGPPGHQYAHRHQPRERRRPRVPVLCARRRGRVTRALALSSVCAMEGGPELASRVWAAGRNRVAAANLVGAALLLAYFEVSAVPSG